MKIGDKKYCLEESRGKQEIKNDLGNMFKNQSYTHTTYSVATVFVQLQLVEVEADASDSDQFNFSFGRSLRPAFLYLFVAGNPFNDIGLLVKIIRDCWDCSHFRRKNEISVYNLRFISYGNLFHRGWQWWVYTY